MLNSVARFSAFVCQFRPRNIHWLHTAYTKTKMSNDDQHQWYGAGYRGNRGRGHRRHHYGRGGRGRRGHGHGQSEHEGNGASGSGQFEKPKSRGGGRPPGLRGKEIGMYYAKLSKQKKAEREQKERPVVAMESHQESHIQRLLNNIRANEVQPPHSEPPSAEDTKTDRDDWFDGAGRSSEHGASQQRIFNYSSLKKENTSQGERSAVRGTDRHAQEAVERETPKGNEDFIPINTEQSEGEETEDYGNVSSMSELMEYNTEEDYMVKEEQFSVVLENSAYKENTVLNEVMRDDFFDKQEDKRYKEMREFRRKLPAFDKKWDILDVVSKNQVVVISGETGCGKTTQVPQFILDDYLERGIGTQCTVFCTQPRRISAVSVAERVAAERAERLGESTGYMIRLENKMPRQRGSILFCTTGIMLRLLESDPLLQRASHIIIDEIHECDLLSDFLIIILKDILQRRPDLKLILMSATLNAEAFSKYFRNCPMLNIPGFTYPVKEYLLEDAVETLRYEPSFKFIKNQKSFKKKYGRRGREWQSMMEEEEWNMEAWLRNIQGEYSQHTIDILRKYDTSRIDIDLIHQLIRYIATQKKEGAILTFVPGWAEISDLNKLLEADPLFKSNNFRIIPLHSLMPTLNQRQVFERPPKGVRKIVIATNIAETSITIDDVVYVIDGGKIKVKDYDPVTNMSSLASQWVSKANAKQRRGRAGRVQPGECYHLYSGLQENQLQDYLPPEILRTRLEELCLQIKLLKLGKIEPFVKRAMQAPSMQALQRAIVNLQSLNALDQDENLLPLGHHLARMPLDPHMGKMILFGAMFCCLDPVLTIAASLSFKDAFYVPLGREKEADEAKRLLADGCHSDHIMLVNAFLGWERAVQTGTNRSYCWDNFLSENTLKLLRDMKRQLAELLHDLGFLGSRSPKDYSANINSENLGLVKAVLCAGLYPNVAKIWKVATKKRPMKLRTVSEGKCELHPKSVNTDIREPESQWVVYHMMMKTSGVYIHDCTLVSPYPLLFFGGAIGTLQEYGEDNVSVDDWIKFKASPRTASLVQDLRHELDRLLEEKITHPGVTNWSTNSKEGALLTAIIQLVTTEEEINKCNISYRNDSQNDSESYWDDSYS